MVPVQLRGKLTCLAVVVSLVLSASFGSVDALPFDDRDVIYFLSEEPEITLPEDDLDTPAPPRPTRAPSFSLCSEDVKKEMRCSNSSANARVRRPKCMSALGEPVESQETEEKCASCLASIRRHNSENITHGHSICFMKKKKDCCRRCYDGTWRDIKCARRKEPATKGGESDQVREADEARVNEEEEEVREADEARFNEEEEELLFLSQF